MKQHRNQSHVFPINSMLRYLEFCLLLVMISIPIIVSSQVTFNIISTPDNTPGESLIYISGDFDGWTGGSEPYRLQSTEEGNYSITLPQQSGSIQFKFTLGSWATVEKGANGEEIGNRRYTFGESHDTIEVVILNWAGIFGGGTATENVFILDQNFEMPQLGGRERRVWVYLPPDYDLIDTKWPVLYMHDGQNLFDQETAFAGEWEVDETLNALYDSTGFGLIVVGIDNGGATRTEEYTPWVNSTYGGGRGEDYMEFIVESLKPHVDSTYSVYTEPAQTGIMGSSLGGLISHFGVLEYPDVFGLAGVFSPSFWFSDTAYAFGADAGEIESVDQPRLYYLSGGRESTTIDVPDMTQRMIDTMTAGGYGENLQLHTVDPSAGHNESFWRNEFHDAIQWLYRETSVSVVDTEIARIDVSLYPNPATTQITIGAQSGNIVMINTIGQVALRTSVKKETTLDVSDLERGFYFLIIETKSGRDVLKVILH